MVVINNDVQIRNAPTRVLLQTAHDIVDDICQHTTVFDDAKLAKVNKFSHEEIVTGRIIGRGGFCTVKEITAIRSPNKKRSAMMRQQRRKSGGSSWNLRKSKQKTQQETIMDMSHNGIEMSVKEYMAYAAAKGGKTKYVVKQVAEEWIYQNRITFLKATVDLAIEAKYLSSLNHPSIIELRGVSESGPFAEGYFIVLDRLTDTLPGKLKKWMTIDRQCKGITGAFVGGKKKESLLFINRMETAFGVADALNYIHSKKLVYRDLKPDNIGFDSFGRVKLFDFGLAKELSARDKLENGLYKLTGFTGSIRYMAPEVGLRRPYNQKVDNYSFSMLLWYIMALEPPYGFYTPEMFVSRVFQQGHRPVTMGDWPAGLCQVMKRSWDARINVRPSFEKIMDVIKREVAVVDQQAAARMLPHIP
mmetsp:Transcript_3958/g.6615  ORF Transcript_3958/g.6615 Transcript_3958/m.6615 type:complete len:417 (-) Transcript_3958:1481-2731(-)